MKNNTVILPRELTDEMAEAIAFEANCCGGMAYSAYEALIAAAPEQESETISLRDHFAALAMSSMADNALRSAFENDDKTIVDNAAKASYRIADAMLKARKL